MRCYVGLGSNLGDRRQNLQAGLEGMSRSGLPPAAVSSVWETEPVNTTFPGWFWNMAVMVHSDLDPVDLLEILLGIEQENGRHRTVPNGPRTLDLDLLLAGDLQIENGKLRLPHPRMWERRFVLEPLAEIAPRLRNPRSGRTVEDERLDLTERSRVRKLGVLATCRSLTL